MKRLILLTCVFVTTQISFGQTTQKIRKVIQVMPQQTFYLNGGMRATFGGKSRTYYKIDLPENTVEWYYILTTSGGEPESKATLNLIPQLTKLFDPTGITALAASAIIAPTGSNTCAVYLMDRANADAFLEKIDNLGGKYYYTISGSRENFREGTVQVKDAIYGTFYLGFKNPSTSTGITIEFEAAAIVEETVINNNEWSTNSKEQLYNTFYRNLQNEKQNEETAKDIANCLVSKITTEKTPAQYNKMSQNEREAFVTKNSVTCTAKYKEQQTPEQEKAKNYGNLGWKAYENGNVDKCIEYSKKALKLDNTLGFVKANLGLCYLIRNEETIATDYYMEALSDIKKLKLKSQIKDYLKAVIEDINNALKKYSILKGSDDIKELFKEELKNY
jgi:tetratricopeptide (TPR) repeat protein